MSASRSHPLISSGVLGQVDVTKNNCQTCQLAKFHAFLFNSDSIAYDRIHSNIWDPSSSPTIGESHHS